jgi:tetratricopeptide (TPR) repeat protein
MTGKLTTILIKKEAEAYLDQGLHQEAIQLYDQLLASSPRIDPAIKSALQSQLEVIRQAKQETDSRRDNALTTADIIRIREGWGSQATETDILVCAQAFCQIGDFREALEEFRKLLFKSGLKRSYLQAMADCLVRLHAPAQVAPAVQDQARDLSAGHPKRTLAIQLIMADHIASSPFSEHALVVYKDLAATPVLRPPMKRYLAARIGQIAPRTVDPSPDPAGKAQAVEKGTTWERSGWRWLRRLFKRAG